MNRIRTLFVSLAFVACGSPSAPPSVPPSAQPSASPERGKTATTCALPEHPVHANDADRNVEGSPLALCSGAPLTGFFRDGRCSTGPDDAGVHVVCSRMTTAFLEFSKARGNDLMTPSGSFAGLKDGDRWCLCAARWGEAERAGVAPPVVLEATHESAANVLDPATLRAHALRDNTH